MTQRDAPRIRFNSDVIKTSLTWLLRGTDWRQIRWRSDCTWGSPQLLAVAALLWAWSDETLITDRFTTARNIALRMFPQPQEVASTFQGFVKLLKRWTPPLLKLLQQTLRSRMVEDFAEHLRIGGFLLFGVDGSRLELPRTLAHEGAFSSTRKKKKRTRQGTSRKGKSSRSRAKQRADRKKAQSASMWITTLWHVGTGLPWDWRLGPSDSSERGHWLEMLASLKEAAMFVGDAGFVGYEYASTVIAAGHQLTIRVGANVKLLKGLGIVKESQGLVYLWPDRVAKQNRQPLIFRLLTVNNGKHPVYLITSVLSTKELTDREVVQIYQRRWGIELFYRNLKQTFGKRKLKSHSPASAYVEMNWSLLGLWCMALYALKQLVAQGISPRRLSFAKLIRAFRRMMRDYQHEVKKGAALCDLLNQAVIDEYQRGDKTSRNYPRKKSENPAGKPKICSATDQQQHQARELQNAA